MDRWIIFAQGFFLGVLLTGRRDYPDALHGAMILAGLALALWALWSGSAARNTARQNDGNE